MKVISRVIVFLILVLFLFVAGVDAQRGCCSWHGGVSGCSSSGQIVCKDGTYSPSCTCTPTYIYGCMNPTANNYNSRANKDDGSCTYDVYGCTNSGASNYNINANKSDGSCLFSKVIKEEVEIDYTSEYRENTELKYKEEKVIQNGVSGVKEISYKIITNEKGEEISKEVFKEEIIKEPVVEIIEQNTTNDNISKKSDVSIGGDDTNRISSGLLFSSVIYFWFIIINWIYVKRHTNNDTFLGKVKNNKILLVLYYILIIFTYLDTLIIICSITYNRNSKNVHLKR